MLNQLTVFMQNREGRLAQLCRTLANAEINMHSLYVADTQDYGVARIFCDTPSAARKVLNSQGFRATLTPVVAVRVPNEKGGLANLLEFLDAKKINIEYGYCFSGESRLCHRCAEGRRVGHRTGARGGQLHHCEEGRNLST